MSKRNRRNQIQVKHKEVKSNTLVDLIIPVYNRFDLLGKCLDAIPGAIGDISYNVICVDNNSDHSERTPFYESRDDIIVIQNEQNVGFPRACNQGAKRRNSPLIFLLNSDVILEPWSLKRLIKNMDEPKIGVAGMLLQFPQYAEGLNEAIRPPQTVQHVGLETNIHGKWTHPLIGWSVTHPKVLARRDVYAVTGAAFLTRRSIWDRLGGMCERYGLGSMEDVDFCMGARELGYNIIVDINAIGTHYTGATAEKYGIRYPMEQNRFVFLDRWSQKLQWTEWTAY